MATRASAGYQSLSWLPELQPGEGDGHPESHGGLRGDWRVMPVHHPLSSGEEVDCRLVLARDHIPEAETERQGRRRTLAPTPRPGGVCGLHVESSPEVCEQDRLKEERVHRLAVGGRVREGDRI